MPDLESNILTFEWVMLLLRIAFIALIYVFLYQVARVALRELVTIGHAAAKQERQATARAVTASLAVVDPAASSYSPGERLPISSYTTVGRGSGNSLVFDDSYTSTTHAELVRDAEGWLVRDLGSTNGTFVNGRRVRGQVRVDAGDEIAFGSVVVTFTG